MLNWVSVSAVIQHIEAPTKAKKYSYWITKAGFVVKINFFKGFCRRLEKDPLYVPILLSFQGYKNLTAQRFYQLIQKSINRQLISRLELVGCPQLDDIKSHLDTQCPIRSYLLS